MIACIELTGFVVACWHRGVKSNNQRCGGGVAFIYFRINTNDGDLLSNGGELMVSLPGISNQVTSTAK
jgi:hypothetical protein